MQAPTFGTKQPKLPGLIPETDRTDLCRVIHCPIQQLEQELNDARQDAFYMKSDVTIYLLPGIGDAPAGVYAVAVMELDQYRFDHED